MIDSVVGLLKFASTSLPQPTQIWFGCPKTSKTGWYQIMHDRDFFLPTTKAFVYFHWQLIKREGRQNRHENDKKNKRLRSAIITLIQNSSKKTSNADLNRHNRATMGPGSGKIFGCLQAGFFSGFLPTIELNNFQTFFIHSRLRITNLFEISLKSYQLKTKKNKILMFRLKNLFSLLIFPS